jgi:predicted Zn-dependent protease
MVVLLGLVIGSFALAGRQLWAWHHFRAARSELEHYHNPQAVRHVRACLKIWPEDSDLLLLAARSARRARSYGEAENFLQQYQELRGLDEGSRFEQLLLSAERRIDQVEELCWRYVQEGHPDAPLIFEALTRGYLRQYRLGDARRCLDRWLQSEPDNAQAHSLEGQFHLEYAFARSAAIESYRRALELDPEHDEARVGLAVALLDSKNYSEAAEHFEQLRRRQPDNLSVQVGLAECRDSLGQSAEAAHLMDRVLEEQPHFPPALALRGRLALESGDYEKAEIWLREAVMRNPSNHRARYNLVLSLHHNGKEEEAQRRQQELNQMEDDLKRFNEIVTRDMLLKPNDPSLHFALGEMLLRGGQREEGLRWLHSATRLNPRYERDVRKVLAEYDQKEAERKQQQD